MPAVKQPRYFILFCLITGFYFAKAQKTPYIERLVSLTANKQTIEQVFKSISSQTSVVFSYSQSFNDKQQISLTCKNKPLRLVIAEILKSSNCSYKTKEKYIIITCDNKPAAPVSKIKGYVYDANDSLIVPQASIYIKQDKHSAITNSFGFFELTFSNKFEKVAITVAKENYCDTSITIHNKPTQEIIIYLQPSDKSKHAVITINPIKTEEKTETAIKDTTTKTDNEPPAISESRFNKFKTNFKNISDTLFSNLSISFLPFISTNRLLSGNTVNNYSFNILAGYSKGIEVAELGGLLNIDNGNVKYVQVGGLGNYVLGNFTGFQLSGLTNINHKKTQGVQIAGIINFNKSDVEGVQVGGITNFNLTNLKGTQIAGVYNHTKIVKGAQIAGICNLTKAIEGVQFSGICNLAQEMKGTQIAGICNLAQEIKGSQVAGICNLTQKANGLQIAGICNQAQVEQGLQIAGIVNNSDTVYGLQLAGIVNIANYLKGGQFSFINVSDTASGIPVGFFSYVKKGYHKFEISADEAKFGILSFGTGVNKLHNIFSFGINYLNPQLLIFGYGLGSSFSIHKKWNLNCNITIHQVKLTEEIITSPNIISKLNVNAEYKLGPKLLIGLGPTVSAYNTDTSDLNYTSIYAAIPPYSFYDKTKGAVNTKIWLGAKLYVKIM